MSELNRTPLYDAHVAAGATMVDFGGWEMPIRYPAGIVTEHLTDRRACGMFDVSHMGRLIVEGTQCLDFLQRVLSSDAAALQPGRAQYCIIPSETGGAVDDAYLYRFEPERYMLVVNASNTQKDLAHFEKYLPQYDCRITDATALCASIAVQGPESERILTELAGGAPLTGPRKNDLGRVTAQGRTIYLSRTGYTGDPLGWELFVRADEAVWLWTRLAELGASPIGLGARDTLRLEAGLPLYGHEMGLAPDGTEIPVFAVPLARFAVCLREEKGDLVARELLCAQKEHGTPRRIVPVALTDRGVIRAGMEVYAGGKHVGWITSGTMVPYWVFDGEGHIGNATDKRSIGFAYLDSELTELDTVEVDVRGRRLRARIVAKHLEQKQPPYARAL